ncbi:hypothetical protein [Bradyrhizobium uaiense]|uniref:hypothetical protein n=1 Tax=Bradyrhizobium uaiense TaxID=2594946 RepID=UPI001F2FA4D0|nr:hypothetical protein [Bradyrhizobium uaiense]
MPAEKEAHRSALSCSVSLLILNSLVNQIGKQAPHVLALNLGEGIEHPEVRKHVRPALVANSGSLKQERRVSKIAFMNRAIDLIVRR